MLEEERPFVGFLFQNIFSLPICMGSFQVLNDTTHSFQIVRVLSIKPYYFY